MGRGGGRSHGGGHSHHTSHRSHRTRTTYHSHGTSHYHSSSSSGGGGDADPRVMGVCCALIAISFLFLAIIVPVIIISDSGYSCSKINNLNRNEQAYCIPGDLTKTWTAEYKNDKGHAKVYRIPSSSNETTTRSYAWLNYNEYLYHEHTYFSVACSRGVDVQMYLTTDDRYDLKFFWITKEQYENALDDGAFRESRYTEEVFTNNGGDQYYWHSPASTSSNTLYYMVFSSRYHSVRFEYSVYITYKIYDVSGKKAETCSGGKCSFDDMKKGEILVLDFPSATTSASGSGIDPTEPTDFEISLHDNSVDWSSAGAYLGAFLVFFLIFAAFAAIFLFKYIKKAGKKVASAVEKSAEKSVEAGKATQMTTVTPAAQPTATPAAQPTATPAGDPSYAAQPYPTDAAPPYPAYSAGPQPYAAQPYPGQPYPGQPYPDAAQTYPDGMPPATDQPM